MGEKLYTVKETAEILKVSERTIFRYFQPDYKYHLKAFKVGREWRVREPDLIEFIKGEANESKINT